MVVDGQMLRFFRILVACVGAEKVNAKMRKGDVSQVGAGLLEESLMHQINVPYVHPHQDQFSASVDSKETTLQSSHCRCFFFK